MESLENMNKVTLIKKFNSIISNLLEQVSPLIGNKYCNYFSKLIKVNSLLPVQNFIIHGIPHEKKINERDPDYFLNETVYKNEVHKKWGDKADWYLNEILNLKQVYLAVDDDSKENLWDIVTALLLLSKRYEQFT
tara:strand:+ start:161 stop:565 length:405 start_codon:yes stop_codon:yes gene_type:complete